MMKGLNPSKALGPDERHPRVFKEPAVEFGPVFAHLFQQSLDKGEIPKEWSVANICPLYKKGDRALSSNYRPVSLTFVPCKLLKHIVCTNIMAHLYEHKLLIDKQHVFRKTHSYETQFITVLDDWAKSLDAGGQVDTFILEFEEVFDTPPHELLKANSMDMEMGWGEGGRVVRRCRVSRHRGVQLILTYSWARPAILVAGKGRGEYFLFLLFLYFHSCSFFSLFLSFISSTISSISFLPFSGRRHKMTHLG